MMTQEQALEILKTGANVFLTGEPGSGKTFTINSYVTWLRERGIEPAITASTGIAATHIGGMTIHAWSGIGISKYISEEDLDRLSQNERIVKRARAVSTLIIDEVSMLSSGVLTMVDQVLRALRNSDRPFGGIQVVLVGDFFQLPPVTRRDENMFGEQTHQYSFLSPVWKTLNPIPCYLKEQHRNEDADFLEVLSAIRKNAVTEKHKTVLRTKKNQSTMHGTELYAHNVDVDSVNDKYLRSLAGNTKTFEMNSSGRLPLIEGLKRGCLSPERLQLKEGAKVMCTKNSSEKGYMNGSTGVVAGFDSYSGYPLVRFSDGKTLEIEPAEWSIEDNGKILAQIKQVPLRLAWAITIHKSQGLSLDRATIDLSKVFEYGHGYVALSRLRTLDGLTLTGISDRAFEVHPEVLSRDELFREASQEAQAAFSAMPLSEINELHKRFILASGGKEVATVRPKATSSVGRMTQWKPQATIERVRAQMPLHEIVTESKRTLGTILTHIEDARKKKQLTKDECAYLCEDIPHSTKIIEAIEKVGGTLLKPIFAELNEEASFEDIRLVRLLTS